MVLVAAGVAFVLVVSNMEPTAWLNDKDQVSEPDYYEPLAERSSASRIDDRR